MRPIHGCPKISGLLDYAHGYYSQNLSWAFVPIDPMNVPNDPMNVMILNDYDDNNMIMMALRAQRIRGIA